MKRDLYSEIMAMVRYRCSRLYEIDHAVDVACQVSADLQEIERSKDFRTLECFADDGLDVLWKQLHVDHKAAQLKP